MNTRSQLACAWASAIGVGLMAVGFIVVAGYSSPPHANASAQVIADFYRDNTDRVRVGLLLTFIAWAGWGALVAVLTTQLARVEGKRPVLSILQLASGVAGWACLLIPTMLLAVATYRPERSPETTQTLHDLGWITAFFPITPFIVQAICIGALVLKDDSADPPFPRWLGYLNFWAAVLFAPGGLLLFFKTGPFAYHGLLVFWVPLIAFGLWILILSWAARRAVLHEARTYVAS
jgi:hypothetical protein